MKKANGEMNEHYGLGAMAATLEIAAGHLRDGDAGRALRAIEMTAESLLAHNPTGGVRRCLTKITEGVDDG